jgi:hypothetical protein
MRRLGALLLSVLGYSALALLAPAEASLPAGLAFVAAALLLVREPRPADEAQCVAVELLRR